MANGGKRLGGGGGVVKCPRGLRHYWLLKGKFLDKWSEGLRGFSPDTFLGNFACTENNARAKLNESYMPPFAFTDFFRTADQTISYHNPI